MQVICKSAIRQVNLPYLYFSILSKIYGKKSVTAPPSFEATLKELENIVSLLESGELPLEEALNEFEHAVKLVQQGQERLQNAEQRIQILLNKNEQAELTDYN